MPCERLPELQNRVQTIRAGTTLGSLWMNTRRMLRGLLLAMCQPRTFYVLGAGASYGLIPITQDMRRIIGADFHSVGVYETTPAPHSALFERVIGTICPHERDIRKVLLTHMPPGALDLLAQRALWRPSNGIVPPQYAVFEVVGSPATLCNFNLDGLASTHCGHRHFVLEMHGRIDSLRFERTSYEKLLEATVAYGIRLPHLTPKLMPQPEPENIILQPEYARAKELFRYAPAMIILGYSFGQRNEGFDDQYSFEYFVSLLKFNSRPIFVVSPTPHDLAELLRDRLSSRHVFGISLRWELFSGAVLANAHPVLGLGLHWLAKNIEAVMRSYETALDTS